MRYLAQAGLVARWSVFALFFLVPIFFVPVPWMGVIHAKALLAVVGITIGFLAWVTHSFDMSALRIPKSGLLLAAVLIPIAYLVSALATGASWEAFLGSGGGQDTVVGFVLLYLALVIAAEMLGGTRMTHALRLFLVGALSVIIVQIVHLAVPAFDFGGALPVPASSVVGSWHDLGLLLVLVVFVSLALFRSAALEEWWRFVSLLAGFSALALLAIINFRNLWLMLLALCVLGVVFVYRHGSYTSLHSLRNVAWWGACAALALGMYFGGTAVQDTLPEPLQVLHIEVRPSWQGTAAVGQEIFTEPGHIFFGSGPNSFFRAWEMYKPLSVNETEFWNTQFNYGVGFIPTSLVTTGAVGLIAWIAVFAALLWSLYRAFRDPEHDGVRMALVGGALFLVLAHALHVPGLALSLLTFLFFGALVAHERSKGALREWIVGLSWGEWRGRIATAILVIVAVAVFAGSVQALRALISNAFVNRAIVQYSASQEIVPASRSVAWAIGILPNNDRAHRAGVELGLMQLSQLAASGDAGENTQAELEETLRATIGHGLTAVSLESRNYQNWLTLARLYGELAGVGVEGADAQAREAYTEAKTSNPTSPLPYLGLAQLEIARGDDVAALEQLEGALAIKSNLALAHYLLSQIHARAGEFDQAKEHASIVVQIVPQDPLGWYNLGIVLYAEGDFVGSAQALERTASLQSDHANALFFLGLSYYQLDRPEDALNALEVVESLNPENEMLLEVIRQIEAGEELDPTFR